MSIFAGTALFLLATAPEAPAPPAERLGLDPAAEKALLSWAAELEGDLAGAAAGDGKAAEARGRVEGRAIIPKMFAEQLDRFLEASGEKPKAIAVTGLSMTATPFFGLVPLRKVELHLAFTKDAVRLERLAVAPPAALLFPDRAAPGWAKQPGTGAGLVAEQILGVAAAGRCPSLPVLAAEDRPRMKAPKKKGGPKVDPKVESAARAAMFDRFRDQTVRACEELAGRPFHRITWTLDEVKGEVVTKDKRHLRFRQELSPGPDRGLRLYHLHEPEAVE